MIATDVIVVGLGPVGSALAALLGSRGISVLALDSNREVYPLPRAAHIDHTGLRVLQEVGCLDDLLPRMIANAGLEFLTPDGTVLAQITADRRSVSGLPASMYFYQPEFDRALRAAAQRSSNVELLVGARAETLSVGPDGATVRARRGADTIDLRGKYVVGCDGAGSSVRQQIGIGLLDLGFHERWLVVDTRISDAEHALPDRARTVIDPALPAGVIPMPGHRLRFEFMVTEPVIAAANGDEQSLLNLIARWVPPEAVVIERSAVYTFHGLVATSWQQGRALLAGDAAHQMPPFLGQGMNSGLRDVANLAWKLDLVLRDQAGPELLETYELERRQTVTSTIEAAIEIGKVVCGRVPLEPGAGRDRAIAALGFRLPSLPQGPLIYDGGGGLAAQALSRDGGRFDDVVGGRFLVLRSDNPDDSAPEDQYWDHWWQNEVGALITTPGAHPAYRSALESILISAGASGMIVRPDRHVLYAGSELNSISARVRTELRRPAVA